MARRITTFDPDQLPADARAVHDRILRERGYLPGPYRFWLASPGFADRIEPVEKFLRHEVALDDPQVEVVVLVVARHWRSQYVWTAHAPAALEAGLGAEVIEVIRTDGTPDFECPGQAACHALGVGLLEAREVGDEVWTRANAVLGERGVNEVLGLLGLYTTVCLTMVGYQMPTKNGEANPFG